MRLARRIDGPRTLADQAELAIRDAILDGELAPGTRLAIEELARAIDIARCRCATRCGSSPRPASSSTCRTAAPRSLLSVDDLGDTWEARSRSRPRDPAHGGAVRRRALRLRRARDRAPHRGAPALRPVGAQDAHHDVHMGLYRPSGYNWLERLVDPIWIRSERYRSFALGEPAATPTSWPPSTARSCGPAPTIAPTRPRAALHASRSHRQHRRREARRCADLPAGRAVAAAAGVAPGGASSRMSKLVSLDELAGRVEDGMQIGLGGSFFLHRAPCAFVRALVARGAASLELVKASPGYDLDLLCRAGVLRRARVGIAAMDCELGLLPRTGAPSSATRSSSRSTRASRSSPACARARPASRSCPSPASAAARFLPSTAGNGSPTPTEAAARCSSCRRSGPRSRSSTSTRSRGRKRAAPRLAQWDRAMSRGAERVLVTVTMSEQSANSSRRIRK